jgi:polar amino acid transport system ATP-binding protein
MVFQTFNLWSHMSLIDNVIEVPIHVLGVKREAAVANAERLLARWRGRPWWRSSPAGPG